MTVAKGLMTATLKIIITILAMGGCISDGVAKIFVLKGTSE
jgi:hypothetical protein